MIYSVFWSYAQYQTVVPHRSIYDKNPPIPVVYRDAVSRIIRECPEDSFIFIIENSQRYSFCKWLEEEKMAKYIQYKSPKWSNTRYFPKLKNKLQTYIFSANPNFKDNFVLDEHRKPPVPRKPRVKPLIEVKESS